MEKRFQTISVVLNVYNESAIIEDCLKHIRNQEYPQEKVEIIIVDDDSTDNTVEKAKKFNVNVVRSGFRNRERAKSIGLQHVSGELIQFMDADVIIKSPNWFKKCNELFLEYPYVYAIQPIRWYYRKRGSIANRYCDLFGINDPLIFFLGKRGVLMATEKEWPLKDTIIKTAKDYALVKFNSKNIPVMGAQGFIMRKKGLSEISWKPYFFHLEAAQQLVEKGHNKFIFSNLPIEHRYVDSTKSFYLKLTRNLILYLKLERFRKYNYGLWSPKFFFALLSMLTFIIPFYQSLKGYFKKPDIAWFLHPLFSFTVPIIYAFVFIYAELRRVDQIRVIDS